MEESIGICLVQVGTRFHKAKSQKSICGYQGGGAVWSDSVAYERFAARAGVAVFAGCFGEYGYEAGATGEGGFGSCLRKAVTRGAMPTLAVRQYE